MDFTRREQIAIVLIIFVVIIVSGVVFWPKEKPPIVSVAPVPSVEQAKEPPRAKDVIVHISGAVHNPGVVKLSAGSRVVDAIQVLGGTLPTADLNAVNLAALLVDGQQVHVPNQGEATTIAAAGGSTTKNANTNVKVNINTADISALDTLPGIGPSTAQKIVEYRKVNGSFRTPEDLKNVPGIGDSKYQTLKDKITI